MIDLFFFWIFPTILCIASYWYLRANTPFTLENIFLGNKNYVILLTIATALPIVNIVLLILLLSLLFSNYFRKR